MDLFDNRQISKEPLAARMRPRTLDEYIGQEHIVGKGRLLRRAIAADQLTSVIFYGPPGTGKTTLARVIANHTKSNFITLNAVLTGVQNIREAVAQAEQHYKLYGRRTILFVDEVHRWNRSQQDALLPWVENGTIILVGATTENPFFEVNKALVSRSRVFQLKPLEYDDLKKAAEAALHDTSRGYGRWNVEFEPGALEHLIDTANGDARSLLNALELAVETTPERWDPDGQPPVPEPGSTIYISKEAAEESIQRKVVLYDKDGDYHYDIISAFIKSLRGRDPDAAMYWLARMVAAGEDPGFIFRRMLISACEDTGLADPAAVSIVESCAAAFDRVGLPEGRYHLAHAALYLATAPKSNSSMAFFDALAAVEKEHTEVPNHLRDASRDATGFGHGAGYMYPHAYTDHWVAQQYLPDPLVGRVFYTPGNQGYEKTIREEVLSRREMQIAAILEEQRHQPDTGSGEPVKEADWWQTEHFGATVKKSGEQLTYSPDNPAKTKTLERAEAGWRRRLDINRAEQLSEVRATLLQHAAPVRHSRNFIWNIDDGLLIWECLRLSPEGVTAGVCRTQQGKEILEQYARTLDLIDRPQLEVMQDNSSAAQFYIPDFDCGPVQFDRLYFRNPVAAREHIDSFCTALLNAGLQGKLSAQWKCVFSQRIPCNGQRLSNILLRQVPAADRIETPLLEKLQTADDAFFSDSNNPLFSWTAETAAEQMQARLPAQITVSYTLSQLTEKRKLSSEEISRWFDTEHAAYGIHLRNFLTESEINKIQQILTAAAEKTVFNWNTETAYFEIYPAS